MPKEFILLAGYRRYNAVKKLGWNRVNANVFGEDKAIEISIDDIEFGDNSRKDEQSVELNELMSSIKQNGLIQPIVVARAKNLSEEDFIALNLTENIQRKDLSPIEISFRLKRLMKLGLSPGEIAVRMGLTQARVKGLMELSKNLSEQQLRKVEFTKEGIIPSKRGKISYSLARKIATAGIPNEQRRVLLNYAAKSGDTIESTELITSLVKGGMTVHQAVKESKNYYAFHPTLLVKKKILEGLCKKHNKSSTEIIKNILSGDIPIEKDLILTVTEFKPEQQQRLVE